MLTLNHLEIVRTDILRLRPLSVTMLPGACVLLTGANGAGKSTALKMLATLSPPQARTMFMYDTDIITALDEYRSLLCYISDDETIDPEATVLDNLMLWAQLYQRELALSAALFGFGLDDVIDEAVSSLSRGMQRRVQLARLLLSNAVIWLLDEPFVHLDMQAAEYLANVINIKCRNGGVVILSSHQSVALLPNAANLSLEDWQDE